MRHPVETHRKGRAQDRAVRIGLVVHAPFRWRRRQPVGEHRPVIRLSEGGRRVQHAQADIHRAIAHPEDPAVAG